MPEGNLQTVDKVPQWIVCVLRAVTAGPSPREVMVETGGHERYASMLCKKALRRYTSLLKAQNTLTRVDIVKQGVAAIMDFNWQLWTP